MAAFGGGLLSFASPCVLPLVPGYLSLMSGVSSTDVAAPDVSPASRVLASTLLFVAGFTLVFVALGAAASGVGTALHDHQRGLEEAAGVAVVAMGVLVAGLWSPRFLMMERRLHVLPSRLGSWAPPLMGMAFAFGWTPCIGPILAGVLALAEHEATLGRGVVLLVAYSAGLGVPFVASGLALARLTRAFSVIKGHFRALNLASGAVLAVFGVLLVLHRVTWLSSRILDAMDALHLDFLTRI